MRCCNPISFHLLLCSVNRLNQLWKKNNVADHIRKIYSHWFPFQTKKNTCVTCVVTVVTPPSGEWLVQQQCVHTEAFQVGRSVFRAGHWQTVAPVARWPKQMPESRFSFCFSLPCIYPGILYNTGLHTTKYWYLIDYKEPGENGELDQPVVLCSARLSTTVIFISNIFFWSHSIRQLTGCSDSTLLLKLNVLNFCDHPMDKALARLHPSRWALLFTQDIFMPDKLYPHLVWMQN